MPINYKDINELTEETNIAGTEKVPVSGTKYVLFNKIKDWIINSLKTTGLDLGGKEVKNVAIEVVTSLPTANNFVGRRVTFNNKDSIWNGTEWESNRNWLSVYIGSATPYMYAKLFTVSNPYQNIELNLRPHTYALGNSSSIKYLISFAYNRVVINKLFSNPMPSSGSFHYNLHIKKLTPAIFEIYVGMPIPGSYTDHLYADITNVRSIVSSVELFQTLDTSDTNVWTSLLHDESYFTEFHSLKTNRLKVKGASISDETINYDTSVEPTQSGTVTKTSTTLWQNLFAHINFLWLKLKDLFPTTQATTHNYIPKIDNSLKKLVKSNIYDNGTNVGIGTTTLSEKLHVDGNVIANGYKVGSGTDTKLLTDGGGTKLITDFAQLEDGKIKASNLPDYLLGQVLYGGSINSSQVCTFSSLYKDKFNTTDTTRLLSNLTASSHVGVYFIASGNFLLNGTIDVNVGDWVISDGNSWGKIDNTDAVASVNGYTGVINLNYEDLGNMPVATNVKIGGFKTGYDKILAGSPEAFDVRVSNSGDDNDGKAFVVIGGNDIKEALGIDNAFQDIFISGKQTPYNNFDNILIIGSFRVYGTYSNAPNTSCGTSAFSTASMVGTLNVFRSGVDNWEVTQQLFWVQSGVTEQYQRSYYKNGSNMTWTVWKRLIKCDDFATLGRGGIISAANFGELFRAPDLIQLWNEDILSLAGGTYHLDSLVPIGVPIENSIHIDNGNDIDIVGLTSGRRYRVTYEVHCVKEEEGEGEVTIKIENGYGELYSTTDYIFDFEIRKRLTFSVILTNTEVITPSIIVGSGLTITIYGHGYQVSVEEIKFPYIAPVQ